MKFDPQSSNSPKNRYQITYDDGYNQVTEDFPCPDRLPQPGDVYEFTTPVYTLGQVWYGVGERMTVIERTDDAPHHRKSSLGNLRIRGPNYTSVWTNFEATIARGWLRLVFV